MMSKRPGAISYGYHPQAHYRVEEPAKLSTLNSQLPTPFTVWRHGVKLGEFSTRLRGEKNISNACAVIALLHELGYAPDPVAQAMADFRGAARRQEELFSDAHVRVFDDYGHHPNEI